MLSTPAEGYERMPPAPLMVIVMLPGINDPAAPVVLFSIVLPFRLQVAPELAEIDVEPSMENVAPLFTVIDPVPMVTAALPVAFCTVPSSTVMPPAVTAEGTLRVQMPVASVPAEKTAVSLVAKVVVAELPVESVDQFEVVVSQVPAPVPCPEPGVVPLMSQYLRAACADEPITRARIVRTRARFFISSMSRFLL